MTCDSSIGENYGDDVEIEYVPVYLKTCLIAVSSLVNQCRVGCVCTANRSVVRQCHDNLGRNLTYITGSGSQFYNKRFCRSLDFVSYAGSLAESAAKLLAKSEEVGRNFHRIYAGSCDRLCHGDGGSDVSSKRVVRIFQIYHVILCKLGNELTCRKIVDAYLLTIVPVGADATAVRECYGAYTLQCGLCCRAHLKFRLVKLRDESKLKPCVVFASEDDALAVLCLVECAAFIVFSKYIDVKSFKVAYHVIRNCDSPLCTVSAWRHGAVHACAATGVYYGGHVYRSTELYRARVVFG